MNNPRLKSHELREAEKSRDTRSIKQPYASELDDRELERAHKEKRPLSSTGEAQRSESSPRNG
jgi:hypothetical protein